jgi:dipeptidase
MKKIIFAFLILGAFVIGHKTYACTNYLVTKGASVDGCTMVSYAADSHIRYGELYWRPAADWPAGSMVTMYDRGTAKPLGQIPQIAHTFKVIGFMNEHQVAIEKQPLMKHELVDTTGIIDYGSLMFLALQRSTTAREAIKII